MHLALHELSRGHGIDRIRQMEGVDDGKVLADQIIFETKGFHLACVDVRQRSAVKGVAEENLRCHQQGNRGGWDKLSLTTAATLEAIAAGSCSTPRWTT